MPEQNYLKGYKNKMRYKKELIKRCMKECLRDVWYKSRVLNRMEVWRLASRHGIVLLTTRGLSERKPPLSEKHTHILVHATGCRSRTEEIWFCNVLLLYTTMVTQLAVIRTTIWQARDVIPTNSHSSNYLQDYFAYNCSTENRSIDIYWLIDWLIDFNSMSVRQGLFYA